MAKNAGDADDSTDNQAEANAQAVSTLRKLVGDIKAGKVNVEYTLDRPRVIRHPEGPGGEWAESEDGSRILQIDYRTSWGAQDGS